MVVVIPFLASCYSPKVANQVNVRPQSEEAPSTIAGAAKAPIVFTDDAGREISLPAEPHRLVSLSASNTEILFALGLEDRIVGVDDYSDYPPAAKNKPKVGGFATTELEKVVAAEPDLVLASNIHTKTVVGELEHRGLKVMVVDSPDVKGVLDRIRLVGKTTGREREAEALVSQMKSKIDLVEARLAGVEPVKVFYELSPSLHTAGQGTFVDDMIRLAGGINVAAGAGKGWPQLNQESLFMLDPEVILLADHSAGQTPEQAAARPGWKQISAVKSGRVFTIDPNLANRAGPRVVEGLELMAKMLHPEKFN